MDFRKVERVLIYRLGSLGDTVVALPALHLIERAFPNAQRLLLTNIPVHTKAPAAFTVLDGSGLVDGFINYPVGTRSMRELIRIRREVRRLRPEVLVYLMPSRGYYALLRDALFFRLCGIRWIVGLPFGELAENGFDTVAGLREQEAARLVRCLCSLGDADSGDLNEWDLRLTLAEKYTATMSLESLGESPLIACGISGKMQANDWGVANWKSLLQRLSTAMPRHALVLVGAKEDFPASEIAREGWQGKALNLCGALTPRETAAVVAHVELFLGPDSGPKYLAAIAGVPCAIAYSARNLPGIWFPPGRYHRNVYHAVDCANCHLTVCIKQGKKCIASITVDEMYTAAMEAWKSGRGSETGQRF
ncbi:MAG TPA: glycosyltransferase family 9 protein [Terracidiphilus sp.]|nr:glycosyltransferase family 9 protein [Terracidiphilus sp.]